MWQQDEEACHLADFGEASQTCTVAAICASQINFRFQGIPRMQQMAANAPLANRCSSRRLTHLADFREASHTCTVAAICASHIDFRFRGIPRKEQMAATRLWPIAGDLADFREA